MENIILPEKIKALSCHCKKSNCLKLYCKYLMYIFFLYYLIYYIILIIYIYYAGECFSNEVQCSKACVCIQCKNNDLPENAVARQKSMENTLDRNPFAFKGKSDKDIVRGCHCLKSHCLKRYCECFLNKQQCNSEFCRCQECKNYDGSIDLALQRSTTPVFVTNSDINVIASSSAHANSRKRTYLLIDDKDNEQDRRIQIGSLTNLQAVDFFSALLNHDAVKDLCNYDIKEKSKDKIDSNVHVKELEFERKKKKLSQKLLNTFGNFFVINKDVQRTFPKNDTDVGDGESSKKADMLKAGKVAKEKTAKTTKKKSSLDLEDDQVILEEEARDLNWKKRLINSTANPDAINIDGDLTSDSELDEKSSKKKAKKTAEEKKVGYMFANLS